MARPRTDKRETRVMPSDEYVSQFFIDPANLDTDNYHYRWVDTHCLNEETQSTNNAVRIGYEPVEITDLPEFAKTADLMAKIKGNNNADPYVRTGNQILMRCPIALYQRMRKAERRESKQQMNRVEWSELSASIKAPTFVTDNSYSRTQELSKVAAKAFADEDD